MSTVQYRDGKYISDPTGGSIYPLFLDASGVQYIHHCAYPLQMISTVFLSQMSMVKECIEHSFPNVGTFSCKMSLASPKQRRTLEQYRFNYGKENSINDSASNDLIIALLCVVQPYNFSNYL